jgi:cell wall-associated NlpC family hydrolase
LIAGVAREMGLPEAQEFEASVGGYAGRIRESELIAGLDRLFLRRDRMQAGDVLAFRLGRTVQHLALCSGDRGRGMEMIHAYMGDPALVCEVPLGQFWERRLAGVWRWKCPSQS